jgi:phosphoribosylformylglycinamidine cyclo-ligase
MPSVMQVVGALGGLSEAELRSTFNGGLGMVCVVPAEAVETAITSLDDACLEAWHVGDVVSIGAEGARYSES